jgi:hypothetical protein
VGKLRKNPHQNRRMYEVTLLSGQFGIFVIKFGNKGCLEKMKYLAKP